VSRAGAAGSGRAWWRWGLRVGTSLTDQATVGVASFLLHAGLARFLPPEDYGAFAVAFTALVLILGMYTTLVAEPMSVLGASRYRDRLAMYLRTTLRVHVAVSLAFAAAAAVAAPVVGLWAPSVGWSLAAMAVAVPPYLLLALARRVGYLEGRPRSALLSSALFALALVGGGAALLALDLLTSPRAFLLMAVAAMAGSLPFVWSVAVSRPRANGPPPVRQVARENWSYGRWLVLGGLAHWLGTGLFVPALALFGGLEQAGVFRALSNLVSPVQQVAAAVTFLLLPQLAGSLRTTSGSGALRRDLMTVGSATVLPAVVYGLLLAAWGRPLLDLLYDREIYTRHAPLLWGLAAFLVLLAAVQTLTLVLRTRQDTRSVFLTKLAGVVVAWVGLVLIWRLGVTGAVVALVASTAAEAAALGFRVFRRRASL
jgi:O-antigen/teichoic acid export membrane protein